MSEIPLGQREDQHLEFKSAALLDNPPRLGRAVVAMLNAQGGQIWVGLGEEDSVAVKIEPIENIHRQAQGLRDFLVDAIEPSLSPGEVAVAAVDQILQIKVESGGQRPYALMKSGGWRLFPMRIDDRIRSMTREEILAARHPAASEDQLENKVKSTQTERDAAGRKEGQRLWLHIVPEFNQTFEFSDELLAEWLRNPEATGNQRGGWHFAKADHVNPKHGKEKVYWEVGRYLRAELHEDGGLLFTLRLESLYWKGLPHEIWPPLLVEYLVSSFRLTRAAYEAQQKVTTGRMIVELALFDIEGWTLRPGSPRRDYDEFEPHPFPEENADLIWTRPLVFDLQEILDHPDHCGYRLVKRFYEAFGISEKNIPRVFDKETGRLIMPEF